MVYLRCIECGKVYENEEMYTCPCGGLLEVSLDLDSIDVTFKLDGNNLRVWKYADLLPVKIKPISLNEGGTPLFRAEYLERELNIHRIYVKHEGLNPSGSFKDRGMTVGVTKAIELGKKAVACASTGNTSASLAMYAAKANLKAYVLLPAGKVALGKVAQALMHNAKVIGIKGNFDKALELVREISRQENFYLLNSVNPFRLEGQKTIAFEIVDELGYVPDRVILPVGNAGNISAIYKGFRELKTLGLIDSIPKMTGIQAKGANPIYRAFVESKKVIEPVTPETIATAIRIGNPVNARKALNAIYESNGLAEEVSDEEIISAQKILAGKEGIGVEPASAASVAGLIKLAGREIDVDETVVCITTGHLLKDPEAVIRACGSPIEVPADIESIKSVL
ncbi:L-threonine synthase [Archaeoglobus sulfaticallidus PM70-1]|uniref:Threonine synthase n=1 Tax=Archaeoglobus sulfaticallidus PM70-1 TaxID=387631 RepID=N0BC60_9EURY|nr:threonine synthase [Archaeoglobus sulfaticallidus]AGK61209.1 L-threonine synthase [Archaeoglobus sulfaticallidus PM70-1]